MTVFFKNILKCAFILSLIARIEILDVQAMEADKAETKVTCKQTMADYKKWFQKLDEKLTPADYMKGVALIKEREYGKAFPWIRNAAYKGHVDAQYMLGTIYYDGCGVLKCLFHALTWFEQAQRKGHRKATYAIAITQFSLGKSFLAAHDYDQALLYFKKAGEKGHVKSLYYIGRMYEKGLGVPQSDHNALELFEEAMAKGYRKAQKKVSKLQHDMATAHLNITLQWFLKAKKNGNPDAKVKIKKILEILG
ncbi:MAG TPA: tetratricopeptide repeat protein [Alphaproteobacteria bacterium]|nr:tetratricopeptide repeat protein [Alphaproteobacteria bacterium]